MTLRLLELPTDWKGFIDIGDLTKKTSEETKNKYAKYLFEIVGRFKTPMLTIPLLEHEPEGLEELRELGRKIFGGCPDRTQS